MALCHSPSWAISSTLKADMGWLFMQQIELQPRCGVEIYGAIPKVAQRLCERAEQAMYQAKREGSGCCLAGQERVDVGLPRAASARLNAAFPAHLRPV
jgi:predicted signal transduction protein with EAL and GGDEF domain